MFAPFFREGVGLHTGVVSQVVVEMGMPGTGTVLIVDEKQYPVEPNAISLTAQRNTTIHNVQTVEHLFAALLMCGENHVRIIIDGPEIPILDGSALPWVNALLDHGATSAPCFVHLEKEIITEVGDSIAKLYPNDSATPPTVRVEIDFSRNELPRQSCLFSPLSENFVETLAPARTFAFVDEVADLQAAGLAKGGSLDNALVIGADGPINRNGYRMTDEPVRHKTIDALGDLFILGGLPWARIELFRPGHSLLAETVRQAAPHIRKRRNPR